MLSDFVTNMIQQGRIQDLLDLMNEESKYTTDSNMNIPTTRYEEKIFGLSIHYLLRLQDLESFPSKTIDEKVHNDFKNMFDEWLKLGAKGLEVNEVKAYLVDNPL